MAADMTGQSPRAVLMEGTVSMCHIPSFSIYLTGPQADVFFRDYQIRRWMQWRAVDWMCTPSGGRDAGGGVPAVTGDPEGWCATSSVKPLQRMPEERVSTWPLAP